MEEFVREFGEWVISKKPVYNSSFDVYFQNAEDALETDEYNYLDMMRQDRYEYSFTLKVNKAGTIEINKD